MKASNQTTCPIISDLCTHTHTKKVTDQTLSFLIQPTLNRSRERGSGWVQGKMKACVMVDAKNTTDIQDIARMRATLSLGGY